MKCIDISIKIFTNYKDLIYFAKERDLNRQQTKYLNILSEYNIKIIYRSKSQNLKIDILTRIIKYKFIDFKNKRLKQQHQIILTSNRLNLDNIEFDVNVIDDSFYYKMFKANKIDNDYNEIRETIINNKKKLKNITFNKCAIINEALYYKNRL